jgi:acetylornithine aminotransferase
MNTTQMQTRWEAAFMANYGTPPLALDHGRGARVWDVEGKEYIDLYAGIAVSALGHAHPAIIEAVSAQIARLAHTSNFAITDPALRLGERLVALVEGDARVFLANSGTEANEAAIKVARRHHPQRSRLVAAERGFHGRTLGALSITGNPAKRDPFAPLLPDVTFVPYGDVDALNAAVTEQTAAVFLEPVLGESGVIPAPIGYLEVAREACDATGALLVLDEVQGGVGRAGAWFSHQVIAPGVTPDVITMAKGLGGGLPIGACIARGAAADALQPGEHGSTFGGNPVAAAAANAVLDVIESEDLLAEATKRGEQLSTELSHLPVKQVRGVGLWLAAVLERPVAKEVEAAAREHGVLVNAVAADAIRFAPALTITSEDVEAGVAAFRAALHDVTGES